MYYTLVPAFIILYYYSWINKKDILNMTKLVSLRIDEKVLRRLEVLKTFFPYAKKHAIMVGVLENVLLNAEPKVLRDIVYHDSKASVQLKITVEKVYLVEQPR